MDAYTARALSVLEGLAISGDPRSHRDPTTEATMSIFAMRFNSTTSRPVMGRPQRGKRGVITSTPQRCGIRDLEHHVAFVMPGYIQNPQTLAILARDEIPYTPSTFRRVQRYVSARMIIQMCERNDMLTPHYEAVTSPGVVLPAPAGGGPRCYAISATTLQIHIDPMQNEVLTPLIFPDQEDVIMAEFIWQRLANGIDNNAVMNMGTNVELLRDNAAVEGGTPFMATPRGIHVVLASYEPVNLCTIHLTCTRYWVTGPPRVVYDSMEADILAVYTYRDGFWDALRSYVLQALGMPAHHYPTRPVTEFRQNLAIAILSRLFDVYSQWRLRSTLQLRPKVLWWLAHRLQAALRAFRLGR
uniref:Core protein VP7 n=1 Tax=Broadhaven virus TaxID=10893 RepID=VP7_BRD|nr:RecName: Full=Core protein VP7 [Broadhaven virus]